MKPEVAKAIQLISDRTSALLLTRAQHTELSRAIQFLIIELSNTKSEPKVEQLPHEPEAKKSSIKTNGRVGRKGPQTLQPAQ